MRKIDSYKFIYNHSSHLYLFTILGFLSYPTDAIAACDGTTGNVNCSGTITSRIGSGSNDSITTLNILEGALVNTQGVSISMGSGTASTQNVLNVNGTVQNAGNGGGPYNTGPNVVEFNSYTTVNIGTTGRVVQTGGANNGEAFNPIGGGNIINNYGLISTATSAAIWFEGTNRTTSGLGNVINNYGTITAGSSGNGSIVGNSSTGSITFINQSGSTINGNISLGSSGSLRNVVSLYNGSNVNGNISGGGNAATLNLLGDSGSDTLSGTVTGFGSLNKGGQGVWTVGSPSPLSNLSSNLSVNVNGGTLILAGNETSSRTKAAINSGGTLQLGNGGTAGWIDSVLSNNGTLSFNRSDSNTFSGIISGSGSISQIGSGTTILSGDNTFTGRTLISSGTLQLGGGDNTGSINNSSGITNNGKLNIVHPNAITIGQIIDGTGWIEQAGVGYTTFSGNNTYTGMTRISQGTLALSGDGSISASSGVHNNSVFDVSGTTSTTPSIQALDGSGSTVLGNNTLVLTNANSGFGNVYSGVMSGAGGLTINGGTQTLTGNNSYTGDTTVAANAGLGLQGKIASALNNAG
ncbi:MULTISPECIES: beta strand repeat-containing protein, partial [Asaia]|uniref:beta strand repeat-containing protein n=1 Tax=Asaia TaxID=91914 RepID=UPI002FC3B588